jgi:hypothetical protein
LTCCGGDDDEAHRWAAQPARATFSFLWAQVGSWLSAEVGKKKAAARGGPKLAAHIWCCLGLGSLAEPNFPQDQKKKKAFLLDLLYNF